MCLMVVHHSLLHRSSAGSLSLEEVWAWWGLPRQWNGLWFIWLLHANILLFDVCRIASDSWAHWVHSCNDRFLKSLDSSGSHSNIYHVYARIRLIFWCFGCSCLQATGEDFNVEEGEGKWPFRALLDVGLVRTTTGNRVFGALKVPFHFFLCIFS